MNKKVKYVSILLSTSCLFSVKMANSTNYPYNTSGDLYEYFANLSYMDLNSSNKISVTTIPNQQQSFITTSTIHFNSIDVNFFTDKSCLTSPTTVTLSGNYDAISGTYYTTPQSLYYICNTTRPGGFNCNNIASNYLSIQYVYNFNNPESGAAISNTTACMTNTSIADYTHDASGRTACTPESCSFANNYDSFNITNNLMVYRTTAKTNGNILSSGQTACTAQAESVCASSNITNGIMGADYLCNVDSGKPNVSQSYYKAMIIDNTNRVSCTTANCSGGNSEHINWIFYPKTKYHTATANPAFTTNESEIYNFTTQGNFSSKIFPGNTLGYWSSMDTNWTSKTPRCSKWTSDITSDNGTRGNSNSSTSSFLYYNANINCGVANILVCVQQ